MGASKGPHPGASSKRPPCSLKGQFGNVFVGKLKDVWTGRVHVAQNPTNADMSRTLDLHQIVRRTKRIGLDLEEMSIAVKQHDGLVLKLVGFGHQGRPKALRPRKNSILVNHIGLHGHQNSSHVLVLGNLKGFLYELNCRRGTSLGFVIGPCTILVEPLQGGRTIGIDIVVISIVGSDHVNRDIQDIVVRPQLHFRVCFLVVQCHVHSSLSQYRVFVVVEETITEMVQTLQWIVSTHMITMTIRPFV